MKVKITNTGMNTHDCKVLIDDNDVTRNITDINVNIKAGCIPTLTLSFLPNDIEIDGDFEVLKNMKQEENKNITINIDGYNLKVDTEKVLNKMAEKIKSSINKI